MAIGGAITGGATNGAILYVGAGGLLAQDPAVFSFDETDNQLVMGAGTAAKPSIIFGDDTTGLYRGAADNVSIATAGVARWSFSAAGAFVTATDNSVDIGGSTTNRPKDISAAGTIHAATAYRLGTSISSTWLLSISSNQARQLVNTGVFAYGWIGSTAATTGAHRFFDITPLSNTGQTLSTEIPGFNWATFTRQWATGAITNQREFTINAPTYGFVAASVITNAATLYVSGSPIAGTNATITNGWAAWFGAKIRVDAGVALGGGGAPTFGTIGGTGPATAAQSEWVEIWTQNGKRFIPAWA